MRRCLALALVGMALCSCSMVSGSRHADGRLTVTSWRFFWKSEAIRFATNDIIGTNNQPFKVTLSIGKSATDDEAVALATEAAVRALVKSAVPIP